MSTMTGPEPGEVHNRTGVERGLLVAGIAGSAVYAAALVLGPLWWPGYSSADQAVSELSALGSPSRPLVAALLLVHSVLAFAFALGVLRAAGTNRALQVTGWLLVVVGGVDLLGPLVPMHMRGAEASLTDVLHVVATGLIVLPVLVAMAAAATLGGWFRGYSLLTLAVALAFGAVAGAQGSQLAANEPTPWLGVYERINIGAYLLWMAVLAVVLLGRTGARTGRR
jgi:hypothetical protein